MDLFSTPFEPNLKFVLELNEDLKTKYFEQHKKAKQSLEDFTCSMQNIFHKHHKLLTSNVELLIINEKLKQIINKYESSQQQISVTVDKPSSEILQACGNFEGNIVCKAPVSKSTSNKFFDDGLTEKKENINEFVPIFSSDFNSDIEDEDFVKNKTPPSSLRNSPVKIQNSPILGKRKKHSSRISNLSNTSSHSSTSHNNSKTSVTSIIDNNINEFDRECIRELEKEFNKQPLKTIENTFLSSTANSQEISKGYNVLGVSNISYGKAEFSDKSKRMRQTTLSLKRVAPVIDISKIDSQENNKKDFKTKVNNARDESFHEKLHSQNKNQSDCNSNENELFKINSFNKQQNSVNQTIFEQADELIETSPAHTEKSKLRTKLYRSKKSQPEKVKEKPLKSALQNDSVELKYNVQEDKCQTVSLNSSEMRAQRKPNTVEEKRRSFDETFFTPAEMSTHKSFKTDYEITQNEDELSKTPPLKKMLLSSFDVIPGITEASPKFAYKEEPVRNKNERAQLPGWGCRDCEKWYGHLPEEERKKRQNQCSKHRGKYKADILTPESFWNPVFDDTNNSSFDDF